MKLADLGAVCAKKAQAFIDKNYANADFDGRILGRVRSQIRKNLAAEISKIDAIVEKLLQ